MKETNKLQEVVIPEGVIKLHDKTKTWSHDKGILTNGKIATQALKLGAEYGELNLHLGDNEDIRDDLGDMLVVMTNLCSLDGYSLLDLFKDVPMLDIPQNIHRFTYEMGELLDAASKGHSLKPHITKILYFIIIMTIDFDITIEECWQMAYDDIKDRKGFLTTDGCFVKSTDPMYEQLKMQFEEEQEETRL